MSFDSIIERSLRALATLEGWVTKPRVLAVIALALVIHCGNMVTRRMADLAIYQQTAERVVAGEAIYRLEDPHRFLYAPIVALGFSPMALLSLPVAKVVWYLLTLLFAAGVILKGERLAFGAARAPPGVRALVVFVAFRFLDNNLGHGQINVALLWLVLLAYELAGSRRPIAAGAALAAAIAIKPFPAVLMLQLALRRQWGFFLSTVAALGLYLVLPALWWGSEYVDVLASWREVLGDQSGNYDVATKANQSTSATAARFVADPATAVLVTFAGNAAFIATLAWVSLREAAEEPAAPAGRGGRELALYLLYATVLLPISWKYYFVDVIPAVCCAAALLFVEGERRYAALALFAAFTLNLVAGLPIFGATLAKQFQLWSFHWFALVILFAHLSWRQLAALPAGFSAPTATRE